MGIDGVNKWSLFLDWGTRISIFYTQKRAFPPGKHVFYGQADRKGKPPHFRSDFRDFLFICVSP